MKELQAIQQALEAPKGQLNDYGKYYYRSCEDILSSVKPLLAANNAVLTLTDDIVLIGDRYYVKATATLKTDSESFSVDSFARESESKKGMDAAQITGAASSYARKYALNALFCIDDTKDPDATNKHDDSEKPTPAEKMITPDQVEQLIAMLPAADMSQEELEKKLKCNISELTESRFKAGETWLRSEIAKLGEDRS